jgi:hypothetical protein
MFGLTYRCQASFFIKLIDFAILFQCHIATIAEIVMARSAENGKLSKRKRGQDVNVFVPWSLIAARFSPHRHARFGRRLLAAPVGTREPDTPADLCHSLLDVGRAEPVRDV